MIKRFVVFFVSVLCFAFPATANIEISPENIDVAIQKYFTAEKDKASAIATYNKNIAKDGSTNVPSLWKVCTAGGLNIKKSADKLKCQNFVSELLKSSATKYYAVCRGYKGKIEEKNGGTERCVRDFKNVQVTMSPAIKLAKEYALIKDKDGTLQCHSKHNKEWNQDYIMCTSKNKNVYYEFEFDDVKESFDNTIKINIVEAVCKIHDAKATTSFCVADVAKCKDINTSLSKFGYIATYKNDRCEVNYNTITKKEDLKTAYAIDNFVFCRGIQVQNAPSAEAAVKKYIVSAAAKQGQKIAESQINCLAGFNTYTGSGCNVNGWTDFKDDIKTCKIGKEQIDFVFDDINESWDKYHAGGVSGMNCIASDGTFDGRNCRLLGEKNCKQLATVLKTDCPECDQPVWDGNTCSLPSAKSADNINKAIKITTEAGVAVAGVALFFVPGAQGGAILALNYIAGGLVITGATARVTSNIVMQTGIFKEFADAVENCHDEQCARSLLREWLQKIQSYKKEFTVAEQKATDELCDHLFNQIPSDSDFWLAFMQDKDVFDPWTCEIKTKKQFWQHMRTAGEVAEIAGSLLRIGNLAFEKSTDAVVKKIGEKTYAFGNNGRPGIMLRATQEGIAKTTGGSFLNKLGLKYGTAYTWSDAGEILSKAGLDINLYRGATWFNKGQGLLRLTNGRFASALVRVPVTVENTVVHVTFNMAGMVNPALGTLAETAASTGYFESRTAGGYRVPYCMGQKQQEQGTIEIVKVEEEPIKEGNNEEKTKTSVVPVVIPGETDGCATNPVLSTGSDLVVTTNPGSSSNTTTSGTTSGSVSETGDSSSSDSKPTTFTPDKKKNVGLIVGLTATGLVATGAVVGGVVAATSKDKAKDNATIGTDNVANSEIENVMRVADGVLGTIDNKQITLVPLPTKVNTEVKIVDIDGKAVAVVGYNGYKLPYLIKNNKWTPLLGIGEIGRWFNVYPKANTDIKTIDMITDLMNRQINPSIVVRYIGVNASGASLPVAALTAFAIINAEFPNGVVQNENMTASDAKLYNDNYNLIQRKLK